MTTTIGRLKAGPPRKLRILKELSALHRIMECADNERVGDELDLAQRMDNTIANNENIAPVIFEEYVIVVNDVT